ncbi:MAG: hypothetical protein OCU22_06150 [Canidatus Methanoxibalbensis ujae]|nr:hypothetical protein [Candidatus Methanoxibalbensis ujae]
MANMMQTWEYWSLFAIGRCEMKIQSSRRRWLSPDSERKERADLLECGDYRTGKVFGIWERSSPCPVAEN